MAIISRLRQLIGLTGDRREARGTRVPVQREPDAESERAVKEPVSSVDDAGGSSPTGPTDAGAEEGSAAAGAEPVDSLSGIGPTYAERLTEAGVETVADLASADAAELDAETGIGVGRLSGWIERARDR